MEEKDNEGKVVSFEIAKEIKEHPEMALAYAATKWHLATLKATSINNDKYDNMMKCVEKMKQVCDEESVCLEVKVSPSLLRSGNWGASFILVGFDCTNMSDFIEALSMADTVSIDARTDGNVDISLGFHEVETLHR